MSRKVISMILAVLLAAGGLLSRAAAADGVEINSTAFPDPEFCSYVSQRFDKDGDGALSPEERASVTRIAVSGKGIESLEGIAYFPGLEVLYCANNLLTSLDVSQCTALTDLDCSNNHLTSLDLSRNGALVELICGNNSYSLGVAGRTVDLATLPGFEVSRASSWWGGTVSGSILTVADGASEVSYVYDCGSNKTARFTLKITHTHDFAQETVSNAFLKQAATCTVPAVYYKSCVCGERGSETFSFGTPMGHSMEHYAAKEPSCTETGWAAYETCIRCGYSTYEEREALAHQYAYTLSSDVISEDCVSGCGHHAEARVVLGDTMYTGKPVGATAFFPGNWAGTKTPVLTYGGVDGTVYAGTNAPAEPGRYQAQLDFGLGQTVAFEFEITRSGYPISGLPGDVWVEIDGVLYQTDSSGVAYVESLGLSLAALYFHGESDTRDPNGETSHQAYPTGMRIWALTFHEADGGYTAEEIPALENFLAYRGTSIRWSTDPSVKNGIRVITAVPEAKRAELIQGSLLDGTQLSGCKLVEYGTLIKRADVPGAFVYEGAGIQSSYAFRIADGEDRQFSNSGGEIFFTGAFVGLEHELCDDELLLRSYMILERDGRRFVVYGGILQRNIGYVAYQNRNYRPSKAVEDYIWGIIQAVYGDQVERQGSGQ